MPVLGSAPPFGVDVVNVKAYGAKGDTKSAADAVTTNTSAVVTSAGAAFTSTDIGKVFRVYNGATTHSSTILSVQSATQVTLAAAVTFTGSSRYYTYGTDDTAAITLAKAALGTLAGNYARTLYFPASSGAYLDTAQRNFDATDGITILGDTSKIWAKTAEHVPVFASEWRYVSDGSESFISARGSAGFTVRGMAIRDEGQAYTGTLVDLSGAATHTFGAVFERAHFGDARPNQGTAVGVELKGTVLTSFRDCSWENLGFQVQAVNGTGNFANVVTFTDCAWDNAQGAGNAGRAIYVPYVNSVVPKQWLFSGCTFEPLVAGAPVMVDQCLTMRFAACGFWDLCPGPNGAVQQVSASGTLRGLSFDGCHWEIAVSGFAVALKAVDGLSFTGNDFAGGTVFKTGMTATNFEYQANAHVGTTDNSGVTGGSLTV